MHYHIYDLCEIISGIIFFYHPRTKVFSFDSKFSLHVPGWQIHAYTGHTSGLNPSTSS